MKKQPPLVISTLMMIVFSLPVLAQQTDEFSSGTETVVKERKTKNADGSEETEIRSGQVRPKRNGGPRVGEIYRDDQSRVVNRVESLSFWSFNFGPGSSTNIGNNAMFYDIGIGRHWEVNTNAEIRMMGEVSMASKDKGSVSSLTLGASWLTSTSDISPIIGANFGYGLQTGESITSMGGFALGAHAGVRFFRTAKTQMSLEGNVKTLMTSTDPRPMFYGLQLGILF